jgi:putative ABC transport system ATP-binding protein
MIEIEHLDVRAGGRTLLSLPHWRLDAGGHALLLGPSGSGKTTLINAIAGLTRPAAGQVRVAGQDVATMGPAALDRFRGRTMGLVFQTLRLVKVLSVEDNLALAQRLAGATPDRARIAETLERLGLAHLAKANPRRLSVGEMQRAAIARAVAARPKLILADEPTSALDDHNAQAALDLLIGEAQALGASLIIATHDARVKARLPHQLALSGGRIAA